MSDLKMLTQDEVATLLNGYVKRSRHYKGY